MRALRENIFFALQRALGSRAHAAYRRLLDQETWPHDRFAAWQQAEFQRLAAAAVRDVPFYRERVAPSAHHDLAAFPIITKQELAGHFTALMSDAMRADYERGPARGYTWVKVTSGGTTGLPTTVIHDADFRDKDRAARLYELHLAGFPFGTAHVRLWGSMHDIQRTRASLQQRVIASLANETLLNAFMMEDTHLRAYLDLLNRSDVRHLLTYADAGYQLARFARRHGIAVRPLTSIIATGGTLTDDMRATMADVFQCRVHNKYGSRDAGEIACDCDRGSLHVLPHLIVEIVDEQGRPCPPGVTGRVLVTFLGNPSFPLIRFDITDCAAASAAPCPCGRPFPVLEHLEGRAVDFLVSTHGGFVSPTYIRHLVGVVHGSEKVRRFQLVQEGPTTFTLALQPETGVPTDTVAALADPIRRDLLPVLGESAAIDIRVVDRIAETGTGKFQYVINRHVRPSP